VRARCGARCRRPSAASSVPRARPLRRARAAP
jgi:hypothetical protein